MKRLLAVASASLIVSLSLAACGGGGGGSSSSGGSGGSQSAGFEVPTEISAVPTNLSGSVGGVTKPGLKSKLSALKRAATDPNTDYSKAKTVKFVNEHTLEQFDIIEDIFSAVAQTHYADAANINQGPYKAMIAWQEERDGIETKTLEPWVVDSAMIVEGGRNVNRLRAWIEENRDGMIMMIKAEFKIYQSATRRDDGSYSDYGVWTLNVKFDDTGANFFAASADIDANGHAVIKINEHENEGPFTRDMKAIMNRSETEGYGKVSFPDWESCNQPDCAPSNIEAKYAYNERYLAVQKGIDAVQFKDRTSITEMTHRYGMFDSATGENVLKTKSFGFPVSYSDSNGRHWGYYGAWQGRHSLWADGNGIPAGTVVTRQDRGNEQTAESYTVSAAFVGTFTKRIPVTADVNDVKGIPVETWVNDHFELEYRAAGPSGAGWYKCQYSNGFDSNGFPLPPTCDTLFTAFETLMVGSGDNRKWVDMNRWNQSTNQPVNYVYRGSDAPGGAGLYVANRDFNTGMVTATDTKYTPSDTDRLWVNIGGSIYIEYNGTGWVEKTLIAFDTQTWTPEFAPSETGDKPYTLPLDQEFYINSKGANYIVKRTGASTYDVKIEIQSTANPLNASTFVGANTVFKTPWASDTDSTYEFITDPNNANFMKLVYKTIGQNDKDASGAPMQGVAVGAVVQKGQWGMVAYVNGVSSGTQFNWDYPREGDMWGSQQYLMNANGYVLLSDPIMLAPLTLEVKPGVFKTLSLQYDGWMHGLPDLFHELWKNGFVMTADISDKIINIPEGTSVTDAADSTKSYLIKPLEVSQFLNVVADPGTLDITVAAGTDLNSVPVFVEHNMGDMPTTTGVKYSEGILVE